MATRMPRPVRTAGVVTHTTHQLVGGYMRRAGWSRNLSGDALDDLWGHLLLSAVRAKASWQPDHGRSLITWTWLHLHRDAGRWWARRQRWQTELALTDDTWLEPATHEDGFDQVNDRDHLQRLADRVRLTDEQVDAIRWYAVHGDTPTRHIGGHQAWWPSWKRSWHPSYSLALAKMRTAAMTA